MPAPESTKKVAKMTYKKSMPVAGLFALAMCLCSAASADTITFTLLPSRDLSTLTPGADFDIVVHVAGFEGSQADYLAADLLYQGPLDTGFATPNSPTAESLIPHADDFIGGDVDTNNLLVGGAFFASDTLIDAEGDLFKVHFTAGNTLGNGVISFFDVFANLDGSSANSALDGTPGGLHFTIQAAGPAAVPLPSAVWGGTALMALLGVVRLRRRLRPE
jgi:hypothetical protein